MILKYKHIKANLYLVFAITFSPKVYFNMKALGFGLEIWWIDVELWDNRLKR